MRTEELPIVDCSGSPRECGRAHGEALRTVIAAKIQRWEEAIGASYGLPARQFLPRFHANTDFRPAIETHTPELMEEVQGIAEGASIAEDTIYAMQLMDEEWWFGKSAAAHCSSLAIAPSGGRPTLLAQTMDLPRWHDGAQALLKITGADGSETMVFTSAGMVGLMGVSGSGVGICVNTLSQLAVNPKGLPVAFVTRGALSRATTAQAAGFLRQVPHASGQNYQLGGRESARTFECSTGGAAELAFLSGRSLHTNHPLACNNYREDGDSAGSDDSRGRLESLRADLSRSRLDVPGIEDVKKALAACRTDRAVSIVPDSGGSLITSMTVGAVIYQIGVNMQFSVCAGPPSVENWREFMLRAT